MSQITKDNEIAQLKQKLEEYETHFQTNNNKIAHTIQLQLSEFKKEVCSPIHFFETAFIAFATILLYFDIIRTNS